LIEDYELVYPLEPFEIADVLGVHVTIHNDGLPVTAQRFSTSDGYTEPSHPGTAGSSGSTSTARHRASGCASP